MEIIEIRKALGMTQVQFAKHIGVHPLTISKWERGLFKPTNFIQREINKLEKKIATEK